MFSERHGLNNQKQVELLKHRITNLLKDHVTYTFGSGGLNKSGTGGMNQFTQIMEVHQSLRSLNLQGLQRIFILDKILNKILEKFLILKQL